MRTEDERSVSKAIAELEEAMDSIPGPVMRDWRHRAGGEWNGLWTRMLAVLESWGGRWMTRAEAARALGISETRVTQLVMSGRLEGRAYPGPGRGTIWVDPVAVEERESYLRRNRA